MNHHIGGDNGHAGLASLLSTRHSSRNFLPTPVPVEHLTKCLAMAQQSPSNSNTQPWRAIFLTGDTLSTLKKALVSAATQKDPTEIITPLPTTYQHYRSSLGCKVYGEALGIARADIPARTAAVLRNFEFFGAPWAGIVYLDPFVHDRPDLAQGVGMWLQSLLLALTEHGLGTCVLISVAEYAAVIKRVLKLPDEVTVLCGLAVGYENPDAGVNRVVVGRHA
ncbi:nitroreductase [Aspergillus saccharolyticus JOP 1030-1]|uniref:Nitroreductase n=1 Tax=Aspergillus saccharolyticus JOP 1030-1 TaxID=1450539 RepID=A0A318Z077_9EURO|nr:Nitroreductase [Aspergillus saccharolyticus JOP 1030-1]PYH40396.1 Nitroreductase [Aspergillus saccharolyticus JOP 1030-1]